MNMRQFLLLSAPILAAFFGSRALAQEAQEQYLQLAEIEIDPAQLNAYNTAAKEQIEAAIHLEPGVLVLYQPLKFLTRLLVVPKGTGL